jgi:hypothetical protein
VTVVVNEPRTKLTRVYFLKGCSQWRHWLSCMSLCNSKGCFCVIPKINGNGD